MITDNAPTKAQPDTASKVWPYMVRALRLRCPVCGISPLFLPLRRVEGITDWVETLEGCPRCDYVYHRESGYFLFPLWMINFTIVAVVGVIQVLVLYYWLNLSIPALMFIILVSMWALGLLSVRHTKAFFMAFDHLIHPLEKDEPR